MDVQSDTDPCLPGACIQASAYCITSPGGPFPLMCFAFVLIGFALSLQNAHCNGFVVHSRDNVATRIGFLHASYGAPSAPPHPRFGPR